MEDRVIRQDELRTARMKDAPARPETRPEAEQVEPRQGRFASGVKWVSLQFARALLPILALAAGVAGYQYLKATKPEPAVRPPQETRFPVAVMPATLTDVRPKIDLYGVAIAGREVELRALVSGRVVDTGAGLKNGAVVKRGDMLVTIDPFEFETSLREAQSQKLETQARIAELKAQKAVRESDLKFAKQQLSLAQKDLSRAQTLARRGSITERSQDDRRLVVSQRQQSVTQLQNNLIVSDAQIRQQEAAVQRLENTIAQRRQKIAETKLVAPFGGYIADVGAQVGRMVSTNDRVATLIDQDRIDVGFTLTDGQFGRIASEGSLVGRKVKVNWTVGGTTFSYDAVIDRIAAKVDSSSGGVEVFARVADPAQNVPLRAGAFVQIIFDDVLYENVFSVPPASVYE
ncbi:MAG: HlyD family efflux transporter periplasmic adaptor subunit, partial [Pseudomonadota bacterium]